MKLSKRESIAVIVAGLSLFLFIIFGMIVNPALEKSKKLDRQITQKVKEMGEIQELKKIYLAQKEAIKNINGKLRSDKKNFAILSFLEEMAKKAGMKGNIAKMKPSDTTISDVYKESSVELKVDGITLNQLVDYLYKIENAERVVHVKKLKVKKRTKNPQMLDVTFKVSTFELID